MVESEIRAISIIQQHIASWEQRYSDPHKKNLPYSKGVTRNVLGSKISTLDLPLLRCVRRNILLSGSWIGYERD